MVNGSEKARRHKAATMAAEAAAQTDKVLREIYNLYELGLSPDGGPGSMGLCKIANSPQLNMNLLKPRRRVTAMIVGNHSAGKSSFINWYIGEGIQKTGVAIETRGFTFVTSGKKRETLTGDATLRFFDFLKGFTKFEGIIPNLSTEITTSKERAMASLTLIDTPGLVDGDMLYPFDVQQAILWLADHVDMILIFFDPIGQATCKRTMQVVEALNKGPHLEKISYYMSKADAVIKEHDRQRVLIQITQNLATRIRNSHAFSLPTFYLPRDDNAQLDIPNALEDVCADIDKKISMTVQGTLRLLRDDCERILARADQALVDDAATRRENWKRTMQGLVFTSLALMCLTLLLVVLALGLLPTVCDLAEHLCVTVHVQALMKLTPAVSAQFGRLCGFLSLAFVVLALVAKLAWHTKPVLTKRERQQVEGPYKSYTRAILQQEEDLYQAYFQTLSGGER